MRYARINEFDVANGPGIRTSIFLTGCTIHCKGCFNEHLQSFTAGKPFDNVALAELLTYSQNDRVCGISILGGEPFDQDKDELIKLLTTLKQKVGKPIWVWTGHTFEELIKDERNIEALKCIDVLIDGPFKLDEKDSKLLYRGSRNQRVLNMKELLEGK